jgi:hypothetical protein
MYCAYSVSVKHGGLTAWGAAENEAVVGLCPYVVDVGMINEAQYCDRIPIWVKISGSPCTVGWAIGVPWLVIASAAWGCLENI